MTNPTPSPAPQWAINAATEIDHADMPSMSRFATVQDCRIARQAEVAAIITKHAAALSEENERLKREVEEARSAMRARDNIGMSREEYHKAKKALEENETLRVHLASERQAKIERGDMFIELQAQYAAAQEWQNGVWGALRVALPDYDEIKEPAHEAIARLANHLDTSQKESLCFRKEISALWSRVASAEKARDEARAAVESSRSRFAELIALAYMPAADPSAKLHSRTWKDECAAHSKHADALAGIARDFRAQLTELRQWSEQAREAMDKLLHGYMHYCAAYGLQPQKCAENARTLLQSHPAATNNLRTYEATAKELFPDKGMEGRG